MLAAAERAAWRVQLGGAGAGGAAAAAGVEAGWTDAAVPADGADTVEYAAPSRSDLASALAGREAVTERGNKMIEWRVPDDPVLDIALDQLTLARCTLYSALLQGQPPDAARPDMDRAVDALRATGQQDEIPHGLLSRAWLRHQLNDPAGSRQDLDEAQAIAARGNMRLFLADCHLTRARLFRDPPQPARAELAKARVLIEECEYLRRLPELEDAEAALGVTLPGAPASGQ